MTNLQWCLPLVQGRGAGLGNELVPWARAYLMTQVLGARCLTPAFGANARGYHRHFGTPRIDFAWHRLLAATLPRVHFGEAEFEEHGGGDVLQAFARFADARGLRERRPLLVTTDGLWGGLHHIARAREFVRGTLYGSRYAAANLAQQVSRLHPDALTVAMHVRLGDFEASAPDPESYRGRFNCALPLAWFVGIGQQLRAAFGDAIQFQLFSDGSAAQLAPLHAVLKPVDTRCALPSDVSDLLAMSQADLLVCSVSSYSVWAAALSSSPYLWFAPQLHQHGQGWGSIWGDEERQRAAGGPTLRALADRTANPAEEGRSYAMGLLDTLPGTLLATLRRRAQSRLRSCDLIRYGVTQLPSTGNGGA
jgi:hypothetical protein